MTRIADLLDLPRDGERPSVGRQQRRGDLPLPAASRSSTRDLRRQRDRRGCCSSSVPQRAGRGRGGRRRLPGQPALPRRRDHRRDDLQTRRRAGRRAGHPRDHPRPGRHRRGLRRAGREARPARHQLLRRLDRLARPRPRGRLQGVGAGRRRRASSASTRPTCWRSATAATTSRCCSGPAAAWRWARRRSRSRRPPTTSPRRSATTGSPSSWPAGSRVARRRPAVTVDTRDVVRRFVATLEARDWDAWVRAAAPGRGLRDPADPRADPRP